MSTARSNAAARNKRANLTQQMQSPVGRPKQQQQQQQQPQQLRPSTSPAKGGSLKNVPKKYPQLSISDAIGLITLRLGRVENIIKQMRIDAAEDNLSVCDSVSGNGTMLVDNQVIQDLLGRISQLESLPLVPSSQDSETIDRLQYELAETKRNMNTLQISCLELNTQLMRLVSKEPEKKEVEKKEEKNEIEINFK